MPIVPAAVLFDLGYGDATARPDAASGRAATLAAEEGGPCGSGPVGAGAGATVGKLLGSPTPTGLGTASRQVPGGATVAAVVGGERRRRRRRTRTVGCSPGPGTVEHLLTHGAPAPPVAGTSTTLALVATDAPLTKTQAQRLAVVAHDALARAIRPVHTAYDGDTVFAVSTGLHEGDPVDGLVLETAAVEVLAAAIRNAVRRPGVTCDRPPER